VEDGKDCMSMKVVEPLLTSWDT